MTDAISDRNAAVASASATTAVTQASDDTEITPVPFTRAAPMRPSVHSISTPWVSRGPILRPHGSEAEATRR